MNTHRTHVTDGLKAAVIIAAFYGILQLFGITCPIKFLTGVSCPGCGMTRAWLSVVVRHDLSEAFRYHPLFWIVLPALPFFVSMRLRRSPVTGPLTIAAAAAMVLVYFYRMFFTKGDIVVFEPKNGLIFKVFIKLFHLVTNGGNAV